MDRAAFTWARVDLRRRWCSLVVLGVLAGITAGFAMASLAGARRADTAVSRFRSTTKAADAIVFASQVGVPHPDWSKLRLRPEVADLAVWDLMFGNQNGEPGGLLFPANDKVFQQRFGNPIVVAGRMWDPSAPDEVVVTQAFAKNGFPLGSFLALLAIAAVSHVLFTSSRHRRRDFAVLRAMGFNRRGTRLALNAQGTAIGLVGLVVGVPVGIAVGRTSWHWVAARVPLEDVPPLALIAVLVTVPAAVLVVNALAVWPGRSVARLHPAELLRSE